RGADVFTYLAARHELTLRGASSISLSKNFRSTEKLIAAVNSILRQDEVPPFFSGEIRYESPVTCGRTNLRATGAERDFSKPVTLLKLISPTTLTAGAAREAIGAHIAATIRAMLGDGSVMA